MQFFLHCSKGGGGHTHDLCLILSNLRTVQCASQPVKNNFYQMFKTKGRGMSKAFWTKLKKNCRMVKLWHPLVAVEACLD